MASVRGRRSAMRARPSGARLLLAAGLIAALPWAGLAASAQTAPASPPADMKPVPVESAPLAPPPGTPAPPAAPVAGPAPTAETKPVEAKPAEPKPSGDAAGTPAAPPAVVSPPAGPAPPAATAPGQPGPGQASALPTLVPAPADPANVDEVMLAAKPAAVLAGQASWDDGFKQLFETFRKIGAELDKAGIKAAGRPVTVFVETDDMGFRFEAMVPIERAPEGRSELTPEIRFGSTPAGKALRFVHKAPYDEIDSTYEAITAYLDAKGITVKDAFIEEYVTEVKETSDASLEIYVYVQPK
ncbi:GyrI-like domain-containing protein [Chelatococcus sp. SYSU_G07232]|uniref:GyrI-like domain-containing protein n=1 Tax=Chelatococcus albus TaxID=3047466 RepID=A0ABT7AK28_9HYPH|nr:GyrI-like domain-containing protein [Chelatococcus sp. SYSU_G07232]MDJ1159724.1 GyrI-like domain-containing protein [Chelatococcus sp. SYSU_G07232]